jgi:hypothetical protein
MLLRRVFYYWQFLAAIALPMWLVVGYSIFTPGGWGFLGLLIAVPIIFITLLFTAVVTAARYSVRLQKAVSWPDVGLLTAWHITIIGIGFFGPGVTSFVGLAIVLGITVFWFVVWELVAEASKRATGKPSGWQRRDESVRPGKKLAGDNEVIIVNETHNKN